MDKSQTVSGLPSLHPTKSRPKSLNQSFDISDVSTKPAFVQNSSHRVLTKIRQHYQHAQKVSPEMAAQVINDFILPMFQTDSRKKTDNQRSLSFNIKRGKTKSVDIREVEGLEAVPGTILGELKLSCMLNAELQKTRNEMQAVHLRMKEAEQAKMSLWSELNQERQSKIQLDADAHLLRFQLHTYERITQQTEARLSFTSSQLDQYKDLYQRSESDRKRLSNMLHEEKWRNDIRKSFSYHP